MILRWSCRKDVSEVDYVVVCSLFSYDNKKMMLSNNSTISARDGVPRQLVAMDLTKALATLNSARYFMLYSICRIDCLTFPNGRWTKVIK